jgi:putative ABC transport system permease protein
VRNHVAELDPDLVPYNLTSLNDRLQLGLVANRAAATISGAMEMLAIVLGAMGIYGTMSFIVQQRRREIGVRLALGATRSSIVGVVTKQGLTWIATGLSLGLMTGFAAALLLGKFLVGIEAANPLPFLITLAILGSAAYLACYVPAMRGSRLNPLILESLLALRNARP